MKISYKLLLISIFAINFFGCGSGNNPVPEPEPDPYPEGDAYRTIIAYWVADNASSDLTSYAISDFNEMMEGMKSVDLSKNHLVIYIETKNDLPQLIHIKKKNGIIIADTIQTYNEQNPLTMSVMTKVMTRIVDEFPAEKYGLIFASHAEGWIPTNNSATRHLGDYRGTQMDITDFGMVLKKLPHFEFILFDACYMQSIEVAHELKSFTDYIVASPTEIPGPGAPYQKIIPLMFADKEDVAMDIGRGYYEYYGNGNGGILEADFIRNGISYKWDKGVSISVIYTLMLDELAAKTNSIFVNYINHGEIINTSSLFDYGFSSSIYYYDLDGLIRQITGENDDYHDWKKIFDKIQPYFMTTKTILSNRKREEFSSMAGAEGIYIYIPKNISSNQHKFYKTLAWYNDGGWKNVGW